MLLSRSGENLPHAPLGHTFAAGNHRHVVAATVGSLDTGIALAQLGACRLAGLGDVGPIAAPVAPQLMFERGQEAVAEGGAVRGEALQHVGDQVEARRLLSSR